MHERSVVSALVRRADAVVAESGAPRAAQVSIRVGALSHLSPEYLVSHFDREAIGTRVEGAFLDIEVSEDPTAPFALDVTLLSVSVAERAGST